MTFHVQNIYSLSSSDKPIRIRGIIDDYSSWVNDEMVSNYFKGMTLEIASVFIDYDDDNRITFTLRNGTKVVQPRADGAGAVVDDLSQSESDELRIWKIVKAHYQALLSVWPALIHTWVHFHFNDLVCDLTVFSIQWINHCTCSNLKKCGVCIVRIEPN